MESKELASQHSAATSATTTSATSSQFIKILGEIVGATNLVAALRGEKEDGPSSHTKSDCVNAFCNVYWGDELIHRTKTISKK